MPTAATDLFATAQWTLVFAADGSDWRSQGALAEAIEGAHPGALGAVEGEDG